MMSMEIYRGVAIVEGPGQKFERKIPPNNEKAMIYEANAIAIDNEGGAQKIIAGGKGLALSKDEAWKIALEYTKGEIDRIKQ